MKKTLMLACAILACAAASAQTVDYRVENSGRIWNRIETNAVATNNGASNSVAKGEMSSYAGGHVSSLPIAGGRELGLSGSVKTEGSGMAYNVSTGNGTGYANSQGWADANVNGYNRYTDQHGTIELKGVTDSGMHAPVGHGVDVNVQAGRSQDGFAAGGDSGKFSAGGYTQQLPIAGGAQVNASVSDTKESTSWAEAGAVTFTGGTPAGQSAAFRHANAGNVTEVRGSFVDPVVAN